LHTWFHHLEWDWRAFSALLSGLASCGTSWAIWAGGDLVTLVVCQHLDGLMIGGWSSEGRWLSPTPIIVIVRGSCAFPSGAPKATLVDYAWLVLSSSCVSCAAPNCGFGVWCQLAREPLSEWITTMRASLPASKWTSVKNIVSSLFWGFYGIHCDWLSSSCDWLTPRHSGITHYPSRVFIFLV
jgi:hypothetical protein